jgi:hypothetical protein
VRQKMTMRIAIVAATLLLAGWTEPRRYAAAWSGVTPLAPGPTWADSDPVRELDGAQQHRRVPWSEGKPTPKPHPSWRPAPYRDASSCLPLSVPDCVPFSVPDGLHSTIPRRSVSLGVAPRRASGWPTALDDKC